MQAIRKSGSTCRLTAISLSRSRNGFETFFPQALAFVQRFFDGRQELRPVPIPVLLRAYLGLFFSYVITDILMGDRFPADMEKNTLDHFVDIFLHGILAEGNPS